jgi:hypothetical protein
MFLLYLKLTPWWSVGTPIKITGLANLAEKNFNWKFLSRRSEKKLMATHLKVGSVFNSPFQNSLQEKKRRKFFFSARQSS